MKLVKLLKSKWWDLMPAASFLIIAAAEGKAFWIGGISLIVWLFTVAVRMWTK